MYVDARVWAVGVAVAYRVTTSFRLSNNWELDKGWVSAHTSGYIQAAGYGLLNP